MKPKGYGKKLSRDHNRRMALFRSLIRSFLLHESIQTTAAKAKATKGLIDRLIVKAKQNTNASKRVVESFLIEPDLVKKLIFEIAPRYKKRTSGFTSIVKIGPRMGDGAMMVRISLVEADKIEEKKIEEAKDKKPISKSKVVKKRKAR